MKNRRSRRIAKWFPFPSLSTSGFFSCVYCGDLVELRVHATVLWAPPLPRLCPPGGLSSPGVARTESLTAQGFLRVRPRFLLSRRWRAGTPCIHLGVSPILGGRDLPCVIPHLWIKEELLTLQCVPLFTCWDRVASSKLLTGGTGRP